MSLALQGSMSLEETRALVRNLKEMALQATSDAEARDLTNQIAMITRAYRTRNGIGMPSGPAAQAVELDPGFRIRPHIKLLDERLVNAVHDVERGQNRHLAVSMPPRAGKSTLLSLYSPIWMLRRHPEWKMILASHDGSLSHGWTRQARRHIEKRPSLGIALDNGTATREWRTQEGGGMLSATLRSGITGRGARVFIIDDPIRDFVEAHSATMRQSLWDWWLSVAQTRLEPPYLVIVVMTRWHEDDFIGRLLSPDYEGDPKIWEKISLPAIADDEDSLGRQQGEPLLSPLLDETNEQALKRWEDVKSNVGTYTFTGMYQQRPAPSKGAIFDAGWWRFWSFDPEKATEDGKVVYLDPSAQTGGRWVDSWDASFKSGINAQGGWVVGQRWVRVGANRYLITQKRGRWSFTDTIRELEEWAKADDPVKSPAGHLVHERLIEERANGAAIINVLKEKISGIKPTNPTDSKEARARVVTPEIESGNVFIPHPSDPGNEWVAEFLSEMRNFPNDVADDQVDTLTQALSHLRVAGKGRLTVPGAKATPTGGLWQVPRNVARAAMTDIDRRSGRIGR